MNDRKENVLVSKSFDLAIRIVKLYKYLCEVKSEYVMSKQVLRSGTAVGALVREAQNAVSKADFIHKLGIAQKECDESMYWLELLNTTNYLTDDECNSIHSNANELLKMIRSAILTSKKNHN